MSLGGVSFRGVSGHWLEPAAPPLVLIGPGDRAKPSAHVAWPGNKRDTFKFTVEKTREPHGAQHRQCWWTRYIYSIPDELPEEGERGGGNRCQSSADFIFAAPTK